MVEIRHVWMCVDQRTVLVDVSVTSNEASAVIVVVVLIVMDVLVLVGDRVVLVVVLVSGPQRQRNPSPSQDRRDHLYRCGVIAEQCPRDQRTDVRSGDEDGLASRRAEVRVHPSPTT